MFAIYFFTKKKLTQNKSNEYIPSKSNYLYPQDTTTSLSLIFCINIFKFSSVRVL